MSGVKKKKRHLHLLVHYSPHPGEHVDTRTAKNEHAIMKFQPFPGWDFMKVMKADMSSACNSKTRTRFSLAEADLT